MLHTSIVTAFKMDHAFNFTTVLKRKKLKSALKRFGQRDKRACYYTRGIEWSLRAKTTSTKTERASTCKNLRARANEHVLKIFRAFQAEA